MGNNNDVFSNSAFEAIQYINERNYWLYQMAGELKRSVFPYDHKKNLHPPRILETPFSCPGNIVLKLMAVSNNSDLSLHLILMAGFILLLNKYTLNDDIIVGTPIYTEERAEHLSNKVLAIRQQFQEDSTFKELLLQVKDTIAKATENYAYPIEKLCEQLNLSSIGNEFPLFDAALLLENIQAKSHLQHISCNIVFSFLRTGSDIKGTVAFNTLLYKTTTIERITKHFLQLLSNALFNPDLKVREIEILSEEEKQQLLNEFDGPHASFPSDKTIHQLFEEQASRTPDHIAVVGPGRTRTKEEEKNGGVETLRATSLPKSISTTQTDLQISYHHLNEQSDRLAGLLIEKGVLPENIVAIMMGRSVEMIVGILGILKPGGAYLPIDSEYPEERIDYMLKDSGAKLLVTTNDKEGEKVRKWEGEKVLLEFIIHHSNHLSFHYSSNIVHHSNHLAYVIFTSGTTGRPKGVLIRHKGFINLIYFHRSIFEENQDSLISQTANPAFDAMGFEIWPCLLSGAALHIVDNAIRLSPTQLKEWIIRRAITISFQPTVMAEHLLAEKWPQEGVALKSLCAAGEKLNRYPDCVYPFKLYNLYGPTEDTVWTTWTLVEIDPDPVISPVIGKPIANHHVYILNPSLKLQPVGTPGELCISGVGLARGYLNNPELTAEKFIFLPNVQTPSLPRFTLYRTGDLARFLSDGNIEFHGRIDHQVKIRGFRVELGEIRNRLLKHPGIKDIVVLVKERAPGDNYLCAYFVSERKNVIPELRDYLSKELPDYMIPSYFVPLDKIPLTPNGKIDQRALPQPDLKVELNYMAPRNETEAKLQGLWADVLNIQPDLISINTSFFQLGGHSLKATELISRINKELNVIVPLGEIFQSPTIKDLSEYIRGTKSLIQRNIDWNLVLIKESLPGDKHLFFIHDGSGEIEGYIEFCKHLAINFNCWGIRADRLESLAPQDVSIETLAEGYIKKIQKVQPKGPFYIVGWSLGGTIAFEMAIQLEQANEKVSCLTLFDTPPPDKSAPATAEQFSLESELNFIKNYEVGVEVIEKFGNRSDLELDQLWLMLKDYLETINFDVELLKKLIVEQGMLSLPNFDHLGIKDSIYYLNFGRTMRSARTRYIPNNKVNAKVHYFKASQSKGIEHFWWKKYCRNTISYYTIEGDHFSIFKIPGVLVLTKIFSAILYPLENDDKIENSKIQK